MTTTLIVVIAWILVGAFVLLVFGLGSAIGYRRGFQDGLDAADGGGWDDFRWFNRSA
jgi:hypothetical protein